MEFPTIAESLSIKDVPEDQRNRKLTCLHVADQRSRKLTWLHAMHEGHGYCYACHAKLLKGKNMWRVRWNCVSMIAERQCLTGMQNFWRAKTYVVKRKNMWRVWENYLAYFSVFLFFFLNECLLILVFLVLILHF